MVCRATIVREPFAAPAAATHDATFAGSRRRALEAAPGFSASSSVRADGSDVRETQESSELDSMDTDGVELRMLEATASLAEATAVPSRGAATSSPTAASSFPRERRTNSTPKGSPLKQAARLSLARRDAPRRLQSDNDQR